MLRRSQRMSVKNVGVIRCASCAAVKQRIMENWIRENDFLFARQAGIR